MSTELQKQVSAFKKKNTQVQSLQKGLPSIFLGPKEAAAVDTTAVYEAGCKGLRDLLQYDDRFEAFESSLFHASSVNLQRELKTKEENAAIDIEINAILDLLSLWAAEPSAHLILEYLVRRYRVHEFNRDSLLKAFLIVHDSKIFAKIVHLCRLEDSPWVFLLGVKESGVPPPRSLFVNQALKSPWILDTISDITSRTLSLLGIKKSSPKSNIASIEMESGFRVLAFTTAVIVEVANKSVFREDMLRNICLFVIEGLKSKIRPQHSTLQKKLLADWKISSCVIISQISVRTQFGDSIIKAFSKAITVAVNMVHDDESMDVLLDTLVTTASILAQGGQFLVDHGVLSAFFPTSNWFYALIENSESNFQGLLCLMGSGLLTNTVSTLIAASEASLDGELNNVDLPSTVLQFLKRGWADKRDISSFLASILSLVEGKQLSSSKKSDAEKLVRAVSDFEPQVFSTTLKNILENTNNAKAVNKFLSSVFSEFGNTEHSHDGDSIFLNLSSSIKELRLHALASLESVESFAEVTDENGPTVNQIGIVDSLLRCLEDTDHEIASTVWNSKMVSVVLNIAGGLRLFQSIQVAWQWWSQEAFLGSKSALSVLNKLLSSIVGCGFSSLQDNKLSTEIDSWILLATSSCIFALEDSDSKTATKTANAAKLLLNEAFKKFFVSEKSKKSNTDNLSSSFFLEKFAAAIADDDKYNLLALIERCLSQVNNDFSMRGLSLFLVQLSGKLQQQKYLFSLQLLLTKSLSPLMSQLLNHSIETSIEYGNHIYPTFVQVLLPVLVSSVSGTYTSFDASLRTSLAPLTKDHTSEAVFLQLLASTGVSSDSLQVALETIDRNDILALLVRFLVSLIDVSFLVDEISVRTIAMCSVEAILLSSTNVGTACLPTLFHLIRIANSPNIILRSLATRCFTAFSSLLDRNTTKSLALNKEVGVKVAEVELLIQALLAQHDMILNDGDSIVNIIFEAFAKNAVHFDTMSEALLLAARSITNVLDYYAAFLIQLLPTVFVEKRWKTIFHYLEYAVSHASSSNEAFLTALLTWISKDFSSLNTETQDIFVLWTCNSVKSAKSLESTLPKLLLTVVVPSLSLKSLSTSSFEALLRCLFTIQSTTTGNKDIINAVLSMDVNPALGMKLLEDSLLISDQIDAMLRVRKNSIVDDEGDDARMQVDEEEDDTTAERQQSEEGVRDYQHKNISISAKLRSMVAVAEMVVPMVLKQSQHIVHHGFSLVRALFTLIDKLCQPGCVSVMNLEFYKTMATELLMQVITTAATGNALTVIFPASGSTATSTTAAAVAEQQTKTPSKSKGKKKSESTAAAVAVVAASGTSSETYPKETVRRDISNILHCLSTVRTSNIQASALGVIRAIVNNVHESMSVLIELLGDFLSQNSAHGTHLLTRGKLLVNLLSIIIPSDGKETSTAISLATRDIVFHILRPLPSMPANHRVSLLKSLAKLEGHKEWMTLLIVQNLLQHTLVKYESKALENKEVVVDSISLSRAAQRRAQRVLLSSDSEEFFHLAEQFLLDQHSLSIIKTIIKVLDASRAMTLFCIGSDFTQTVAVGDTEDVARLLHHFYTLRNEHASVDVAMQRGQSASLAMLQLEFVNEVLLSPQFHRQLASDMLANRVAHNDMMEVAECSLQICVECDSLRQARQRSTNKAIILRLENELHHLSAKLLSEIFADLSLNVLGNMQVLLDGPSFLTMIQELLDHEVPAIRQRAIIFLKDRLQSLLSEKRMSQIDHGLYLDLCSRLRAIIKTNLGKLFTEKNETSTAAVVATASPGTLSLPFAQSALLAIDVLILKLGKTPQWQTIVLDILGEYLGYLDPVYAMVGLRSSSGHYQQKALESRKFLGSLLLSCSSLCMALHAAALPSYPSLMDKTMNIFVLEVSNWRDDALRAANLESDRRAHILFLRSLISASTVMFSSLPKFSHPYLTTMVPLLLEVSNNLGSSQENVDAVDISGVEEDAEACLTVIGSELPPRLALPAICSCLRESIALGGDATYRYITLLQLLVNKADRMTCVNNMATILPTMLALMKSLKYSTTHLIAHNFDDVQEVMGELVVEICLKLTENELKTFIVRLGDWKNGNNNNSSSGSNKAKESEMNDGEEEEKYYRFVHFYATIQALLDRFQSLFFSSIALLWTDMMNDLDTNAKFVKRLLDKAKSSAENSSEGAGSKKRKRSVDLFSLFNDSNKQSTKLVFNAVGHVMSIVKSLCAITGASFIDEKRYETIYPKILAFFPMWQAFDGDESYFHFVRDHLITAVCELCVNINRDLLWKPLNHQVLLFTRNSSPLVKITAVDLLRDLFEKVGADYLAVLPECLSYISELLEDDNLEVVKHTRQAIDVIEELSGESLDTYLQ